MDERSPLAASDPAHVERRSHDHGPPPGLEERRRPASDALKMQCPFCSASASTVVRSYAPRVSNEVTRRRECGECGRRFPTTEHVDYERLARELADDGHVLVERSAPACAVCDGVAGVDLSIWHLPATWENVERLLHRLWGYAKARGYGREEKNAFGAFQSMLTRIRYDDQAEP